jgi:hypothetical protein
MKMSIEEELEEASESVELAELREYNPLYLAELIRNSHKNEGHSFPASPLATAQSRALEEHGVSLYYP